ncbi:MULE domain-containing protein [Aphis craccivora]|uniref:MULE domain-containing protein n=1 Tax=Aphis craccivora TaxID=307492 RepID=A0A6G0ZPK5_APHCR|nr:MULE domain-containing protein [Aphis craccivora]
MDGTFSNCPKYFTHMFTIHGLINGYYIPLAICLLSDKFQNSKIKKKKKRETLEKLINKYNSNQIPIDECVSTLLCYCL